MIVGLESPACAQLREKVAEEVPRLSPAATELGWNVSKWKTMHLLTEVVDFIASTVVWAASQLSAPNTRPPASSFKPRNA